MDDNKTISRQWKLCPFSNSDGVKACPHTTRVPAAGPKTLLPGSASAYQSTNRLPDQQLKESIAKSWPLEGGDGANKGSEQLERGNSNDRKKDQEEQQQKEIDTSRQKDSQQASLSELAAAGAAAHANKGTPGVPNGSCIAQQAARQDHEMRNTPAHAFLGMPEDNVKAKQLEELRLSDFDKYRRFAQRWFQRRSEKQRQQQPQQTLGQLLQPPSAQNAVPGQSLRGVTQHQHQQQEQKNWGLLHHQLQHGVNLGLPPNQPHPYPRHHPQSPFGAQSHNGVPLQGGHPLQAGMMSIAQRQAQAFALAQGMQAPAGSGTAVPQPPSRAVLAGDAIDLTDDTAAPAAANSPATLPAALASNAQSGKGQHEEWRAYEAYTQRQQQHYSAQQYLQLHQHQQQHGAGVHAHLQHMHMLQNGAAAAGTDQSALGFSPEMNALHYSQHEGHRKLPGYSNGSAGMKRPRYEERHRYEADENQAGTVTFSLISTSFFTAKIRKPTPAAVHTYFKLTPGATYDEKERRWKFPLGAHENLAGALSRQGVQVVPVPRQALAAATLAVEPDQNGDGAKEPSVTLCDKMVPECIRKHLAPFQKQGIEFVLKKEGRAMIADEMGLGKTIQAISCAAAYESEWPLLIVSPSSARYHWEHELLKWLDEDSITKQQIMVVCKSKQDLDRSNTKVVIISYELVNRMREELDLFNFGVVVCDECHYLKNQRAARTKAIVPLATKARRAILLSGTPALSRPSELFTQLNLLSASTWASFRDFGKRYCSGKKGKGKKGKFGVDFSGASHIAELHALLGATVMVRRLKKNILKHLPPKQRSLVEVHVDDEGARRELQRDLSLLATRHHARLGRLAKEHAGKPNQDTGGAASEPATSIPSPEAPIARPTQRARTDASKGKGSGRKPKVAPGAGKVTKLSALPPASVSKDGRATSASTTDGSVNGGLAEPMAISERSVEEMTKAELAQERRSLLMKLFADTGTAKIPAVIRHVSDVLADEMTGGKVLVFAHHRNVLDALERAVVKTGRVEYIRIDGRTKPKDRQDLVDTFQNNPSVRVALLGLTAAGIGITLTAASRVVFAELYWTPAQLLQAEDRCHRIGQATVVKVQYLVAKGSLDDALWPLIQEKIKLLGEMVEGEVGGNQMEVETPVSKKARDVSSSASGVASVAIKDKAAELKEITEIVSPEIINGSDAAAEEARAAFQALQEVARLDAQELAVEDMRHELDDEGRREFFEEQGDDGENGSKGGGGSDGYSSGYSDGGGGQDAGDTLYEIVDSDVEDCDVGVAAASTTMERDTWSVHSSMGDRPSWEQGGNSCAPIGLHAAIAAAKGCAKGCAEQKETRSEPACSVAPKEREEVIDLLSGDEVDKTGVDTLVVLDDDDAADHGTAEDGSVPGLLTRQPFTSQPVYLAHDTGEGTLHGSTLPTGEAPGPVDGIPVDDGDKNVKGPTEGNGCPRVDIAS